jgi:DNA mismatch repair protein MutL
MRHQKIRQAEDLFSLHTKGFRGEPQLIAAIAHVEMKTRNKTKKIRNTIIVETDSLSQDMAVLPKGTSFAVKISFQYSCTS